MRWRLFLALLILFLVLGQPALVRAGRAKLVFGRAYNLPAGEQLPGDLLVVGGDAILGPDSAVRGDVLVLGGSARIEGSVGRHVLAFGGDATVADTGAVAGDVLASGIVDRAPGAAVGGRVRSGLSAMAGSLWFGWPWALSGNAFLWLVQLLLGSLVVVLLGLLVFLVAPRAVATAGETVARSPLQSTAVGCVAAVLALPVVPFLAITLLGLPLALLIAVVLGAGLAFGWVASGLALGTRLLAHGAPSARRPLRAMALGLFLFAVALTLPWLGPPLIAVAGIWGLGAAILTRFGTRPFRPAPPRALPPDRPS